MKKILCLLLAILIVGGMLTACGGETNSGKTEKENSVQKDEPSEVYLIDFIVRVTTSAKLHRNEEGIITSFDYGYKKEYICDYDANANLTKISLFHYNEHDGKRVYYENPEKVWDFTYDAEGKLIQYVAGDSDPWTYQYDANGRLTTIVLYEGVEVRYTYDAEGRVTAKRVQNTQNLDEECLFEYDAEGKLTKYREINYSHGETSYESICNYSYDSAGVTSIARKIISYSGENEQNIVCEYDDNGCMVGQEIEDQGMMYEVKYVSMELTGQQAQRAQENTEYILSFCNLLLMPNAIYFDPLVS